MPTPLKALLSQSLFTLCLAASYAALAAVPSPASEPLGYDAARHLLNRVEFTASDREIRQYARLTRLQAADRLLAESRTAAQTPAPDFVNDPITPARMVRQMDEEERKAFQGAQHEKGIELRAWWYREMLATSSPLTEKMTLFWHNHFVSSQEKVKANQLMYRQNVTLRRNALGNFRTLLHEISKDPAMLVYLDNATSKKGQPNENFAREAMELFTLGEGHYSEHDIKEAARAFTGWSIDPATGGFVFRPFIHDGGHKTVLGHSGDFDGDAVLDILIEQPACAEFVTRKLWREFVSPDLDAQQVTRLAAVFRDSDYDIKTLLRALLTSDAFYAPENRGTLVKSPVELIVGTLQQFDIRLHDLRPAVFAGTLLGQNIFSPPNVRGWPGGEAWINSTTLLARKQFLARVLGDDGAALPTDAAKGSALRAMRAMIRGLTESVFAPQAWLHRLPGDDDARKELLLHLLLAARPQNTPGLTIDAKTMLADLVSDPVYQLK